jgi:hypothetical protein
MRLLICGDRRWYDKVAIKRVVEKFQPNVIIEGEAPSADSLAREVGEEMNIAVEKYPANWEKFGRAAGPIRNSQMLKEGKPDVVVGFHYNINESKGTKNMLAQAKQKGKPAFLYSGSGLKEF